jgi:hypothetical protein
MFATFADLATIRDGDLVFFFKKRRIYGVGRLERAGDAQHCVVLNYPGALTPAPNVPSADDAIIGPDVDAEWRRIRVVVRFRPFPHYFSDGIDMDEFLSSPWADDAWGLRFWQGFSFQQLGEREANDLLTTFYRRFANDVRPISQIAEAPAAALDVRYRSDLHRPFAVSDIVAPNPGDYIADGELRSEELLHGLLVDQLDPILGLHGSALLRSDDRLDIFHELAASPPKPPTFGDWIDLMTTRSYPTLTGDARRAIHYEVIEVKKGSFGILSQMYDKNIPQVMKYVDFIAQRYAGGNYAAVSATVIARRFGDPLLERHRQAQQVESGVSTRAYVLDPHDPNPTRTWQQLRLLTYSWDGNALQIEAPP